MKNEEKLIAINNQIDEIIEKAVKTLDKILRRMQKFQNKKQIMLPKLEHADKLKLSHDRFNV